MQKIVVSRDDNIYKAFADVAQGPKGELVVTYRESMAHAPWPFSRLCVQRSLDGGMTWPAREVLLEKVQEKKEGSLNCSRITACADGTLLLIVDHILHGKSEFVENCCKILLYRSIDGGKTWDGPHETGITEGIVPSIKELSNGNLIIGTTRVRSPQNMPWKEALRYVTEEQLTYISKDKGKTWEGPFVVPSPKELRLDEGDYVELDDGTLVVYMREDKSYTGWKSTSTDGGRTWSEAFRGEFLSCCGRPSAGRLRSGEILITYRFCTAISTSLALYMETPAEAVRREPIDPAKYDVDYRQARFAFIDNDRSIHPDSGYSGWVQLPNGNLFVVNYVTDDAPRGQIRGYLLTREDFFLFPEGGIPWLHPGTQPYIQMCSEWAQKQQEANLKRDWNKRVPTQK